MKRVGFIFEKICDRENIRLAMHKAAKGKTKQKRVARILEQEDLFVEKIHRMLLDGTFEPAPGKELTIHDRTSGKIRTIHKPKFYPDHIIHWAIMLQIEPLMRRGMYQYCVGSVPGRGTSFGRKTIRKWIDRDPRNTKYVLKIDITKFFPSVLTDVLMDKMARVIKDKKVLSLIQRIVSVLEGLPIGFYPSQWWSNFFLQDIDHFIKQELGATYMLRYVDDIVIFGPNKRKLHRMRKAISERMNDIGLTVKDNWQVFRMDSRPLDFLGFRFYRRHTTLRRKNALRIRRRARKIAKKGYLNHKDASAIISYWGWIKVSNSHGYYHKYVRPYVSVGRARKAVSEHARRQANQICTAAGLRPGDPGGYSAPSG